MGGLAPLWYATTQRLTNCNVWMVCDVSVVCVLRVSCVFTVCGGLRVRLQVKRMRVSGYKEVVMQPLDVAIAEMQAKVTALAEITSDKSPNMVMLQMQVQGIVSMQVNAGPMEFASVFLQNADAYEREKIVKLQDCFVQMLHLIDRALNINGTLIADNQVRWWLSRCKAVLHMWVVILLNGTACCCFSFGQCPF